MKKILENIYNDHIDALNEANKQDRYIGNESWFQASNAGLCIKKLYYNKFGFKRPKKDIKSNRLLRLGTIVHVDIQNALLKDTTIKKLIEHEVKIEELNVRGFLDIALLDTNPVMVVDIKTTSAFKWQKMFGRDYNRDTNPSENYQLQLATYVYALSKELNLNPYEEIKGVLFYYKKDNSDMKWVEIDSNYIDKAIDYWEEANSYKDEITKDNINDILIPGKTMNVPVMRWECNIKYCDFAKYCNSPHLTKE